MSFNVCPLPWMGLSIDSLHQVSLCCSIDDNFRIGNWNKESLESMLNKVPLTYLRSQMLDGKAPKVCRECYEVVAQTVSVMNSMAPLMKEELDSVVVSKRLDTRLENIRRLEIGFNNICNCACRMCGPGPSNAWYKDAEQMGLDVPKDEVLWTEQKWKDIEAILPHLKVVYLWGGEPLITHEHYKFIEMLYRVNPDCSLTYNTNLTKLTFGGHDFIEEVTKFKNLAIDVSVDALGERGAYIRKGSHPEKVLENTVKLKKMIPHARIGVNLTLSVLNIIDAIKVLHLMNTQDDFVDISSKFSLVFDFPYTLLNLPLGLRDNILERYKLFLKDLFISNQKQKAATIFCTTSIIKFLKSLDEIGTPQKDMNFFYQFNDRLDQLRNESFTEIFPDIDRLYKSFK